MVTSQSLVRASPIAMKMPMIEVHKTRTSSAPTSDPAVFDSALSAVVHDKTQPDETRRKAARLLIPHLQVELARLREERACARTGTLREREHEREVIGWT